MDAVYGVCDENSFRYPASSAITGGMCHVPRDGPHFFPPEELDHSWCMSFKKTCLVLLRCMQKID